MTVPPEYDIVIVGGGMVGASLACALSTQAVRIAVVETVPPKAGDQPSYDDRSLALSLASIRILDGLELWEKLADSANPIRRVHVSDQHHFGFVRLYAEMMNVPALGHVVIARELGRVLLERLNEAKNIDFLCPSTVENTSVNATGVDISIKAGKEIKTISCRLAIAADGTNSKIRELLGIKTRFKDYKQTAIVTNVTTEKPHLDTAYERFTKSGPLALLPLAEQRCGVVFTVNAQDADHYMQMDNDLFTECLQSRFGRRLGKFLRIGERKSYPIKYLETSEQVSERVVVLGNATHTIHPNGAQGFNLGLRDVAGLAEVLLPSLREGKDPGKRQLLDQYVELRQGDQKKIMRFSDGLASMFYNDLPHKVMVRNAGLLLTDMIPPLKRSFLRMTMGTCGRQPSLVRGLSI